MNHSRSGILSLSPESMWPPLKQEISDRFASNIARVRNLVAIYKQHLAGTGRGRRNHQRTDVLRAAAVLLHASMEDVLRSLAYWKLPHATQEVLKEIAFVGQTSSKLDLGVLSQHRGKSVDSLIKESVDASLERSNYNNSSEIIALLKRLNLDTTPLQVYLGKLEDAMKRRHQIVHRADYNPSTKVGRGVHRVSSIAPTHLEDWINNLESFVKDVLAQV